MFSRPSGITESSETRFEAMSLLAITSSFGPADKQFDAAVGVFHQPPADVAAILRFDFDVLVTGADDLIWIDHVREQRVQTGPSHAREIGPHIGAFAVKLVANETSLLGEFVAALPRFTGPFVTTAFFCAMIFNLSASASRTRPITFGRVSANRGIFGIHQRANNRRGQFARAQRFLVDRVQKFLRPFATRSQDFRGRRAVWRARTSANSPAAHSARPAPPTSPNAANRFDSQAFIGICTSASGKPRESSSKIPARL
jgi:hypothetical protein